MVETTDFSERTNYISETHGVSANCARALQLFELGFSASGAASLLGVTESTCKKYKRQIEEKIGQYAHYTLPKPAKYDTFPTDDKSERPYVGDPDGFNEPEPQAEVDLPLSEVPAECMSLGFSEADL